MKLEDKQLLLQDLCARLPYGVIVQVNDWLKGVYDSRLTQVFCDRLSCSVNVYNPLKECICIDSVKPHLRPMSSMTEEEKKEFIEYTGYEIEESVNGRHYEYYLKDFCGTPDNPSVNTNGVDWLNKKMFDYRGLIPKDLAISTEVFNPYNKD